jgi:hypothetical protein
MVDGDQSPRPSVKVFMPDGNVIDQPAHAEFGLPTPFCGELYRRDKASPYFVPDGVPGYDLKEVLEGVWYAFYREKS